MGSTSLLESLKSKPEIIADQYDGSYELVREIINAYRTLDDYSDISYLDLDAVYAMALGTWKLNVEKKKERVSLTCLPDSEKQRLITLIDNVWDAACYSKYEHDKEYDKVCVGMFGSGFMTFKSGEPDNDGAKRFIEMCADISQYVPDDTDIIYSKAENVFSYPIKGMQAGAASVILHCLMPTVFPIINSNAGNGTIFSALGIKLTKPSSLETYISNCRKIRDFRDLNLETKNYRIMDLMAAELNDIEDITMTTGNSVNYEKNMILYGPPGTGKTYNTARYAVAICDGKSLDELSDYDEVLKRYKELKDDKRIAFTTFHQSYGYEEFIEGIKPVMSDESGSDKLEYKIEPGVFKKFCDEATAIQISNNNDFGFNNSPTIWKVSLEGTGDNPTRRECLDNGHIRIGWDEYGEVLTDSTNYEYGGETILNAFINKMRVGDIVLSCYSASTIDAIGVVTGDYEWSGDYNYYNRVRSVNWLVKDIREDIVDINNGTPMTLSSVYKLKVQLQDVINIINKYIGVTSDNNKQNYVFIIDEINRGNISKIFGELITLIETTKRLDEKESMTCKLPYSREDFGVPSNVYILGTMNTADRSIALMDTALRRRFSFVEMMPKSEVLADLGITEMEVENCSLNIPRMLDVINKRIEVLFNREHTIGHAFFTDLKDGASLEKLERIFKMNVIPLLQEYFYEDYEKIQLVLGDNKKSDEKYKFIVKKEETASSIFNGNPELDSMNTYKINEEAFSYLESYVEIYDITGDH